jgi:hypothetical protein
MIKGLRFNIGGIHLDLYVKLDYIRKNWEYGINIEIFHIRKTFHLLSACVLGRSI